MWRSRILISFLAFSTTVASVSACTTSTAPSQLRHSPLFYAKDGSIYVSDPLGTPGRKITDGPADAQPAPSPDGSRIAYVHKANRADRGGELWLLDAKSGKGRRLVEPSALAPKFGDPPATVNTPRWSPSGDRIAFLTTTFGGGLLVTASADTGAVSIPKRPLLADESYAWAPNGKKIAWVGGRSDVSPVDVNVFNVGGDSTPIVKGANATSVSFDADGRTVLFSNTDATGKPFAALPFEIRQGGVLVVDPPSDPHPLVTGTGTFSDVQALSSGKVAFTEWIRDQRTRKIGTFNSDRTRDTIAETRSDAPAPVWTWDGSVAYVGTAEDRPLLVTQDGATVRVDAGVDSFAWPPGA